MKALLFSVALMIPGSLVGQQSGYAARVLEGISNRGENQGEPYVTAGDRAYVIGTQDGNFPDMGSHVQGEMGGVWVPPIKLLDGLWATVSESAAAQKVSLSKAGEFINYPVRQPLQIRLRAGQPDGGSVPVQPRQSSRHSRAVHLHQRHRSSASADL